MAVITSAKPAKKGCSLRISAAVDPANRHLVAMQKSNLPGMPCGAFAVRDTGYVGQILATLVAFA